MVITNTILISVAVIIFVLAFSFTSSLSDTIERAVYNNLSYRTIVITGIPKYSVDEVIEKVEENKNIIKVMNSDEYMAHVKIKDIGKEYSSQAITFIGADINSQPYVIKGRSIQNSEKNVCLIPQKIYLDYSNDNFDKEKYIDGNELLGETINVEYYSFDNSLGDMNPKINKTFCENYMVVGIYDAEENVMDGNSFFVPFYNVNEITQNINDNTILNPNTTYSNNKTIMAIVDNPVDIESTLNSIQELGYRALVRSTANTKLIDIVNIVVSISLSILILIVLANIISSSIKSINDRQYEIGMLKSIGYKNKDIQVILIFENLIVGIRSFIIGLVISIAILSIVSNCILIKNYSLNQLDIKINIEICFIALFGTLIVPLLASVLCGKAILNKTPLSLNKEK